MNTSLICLSLKYINKNYDLVVDVSKWIYLELTRLNYKESKFVRSLDKKDFEIIKILIKFNENKDLLSQHLTKCCSYNKNSFDIVKLLIDNGADIHVNNDEALRYASWNRRLKIIKLLIESGANIYSQDDEVLRHASKYGRLEIVKLLIENGANVHAGDDQSLRWASSNGHLEIVKLLIENGVKKINKALRLAKFYFQIEVANFLESIG